MTSFLVGIIVLIAVTLAVSKSLVSDRTRGGADPDREYGEDPDTRDIAGPDHTPRARTRKPTEATGDDLVRQDAVEEDERLTGVWE